MRNRLFFDLEVSPNIGFFWQSGHQINVGYESIIKERAIICACYKWEGQKTIYHLTWDAKQNDKKLVQQLLKVMATADEVVGHNGDNFDIKWLRTRALFHRVPMEHNVVSIDTLKQARGGFRFNSNRLDYLGQFLFNKGKISTSYSLWKDIVLNKCTKSMREMVKYCKRDVQLLEDIHTALKPYTKSKTALSDDRKCCPECGSDHHQVKMHRILASGSKAVQLQCMSCGKYWQIPYNTYYKIKKK